MARGYSSANSEYFNRNLPSINKLKAKIEANLPGYEEELTKATQARDALWKQYTTVVEKYYYSDGMWPEREFNAGVTEDQKKMVYDAQKEVEFAQSNLNAEEKNVAAAKKQYEDKADARKRAKEFLPELPNVKRDKEGYLSLDSLESDKEGKKSLKKLPQEALAGIKKQLIKDAASEAFLNGEDNDYFKGKVERTQTMETPSGLVDVKIVADVEYRNDPRGDSNTDINTVKFFVRKL
jgi:hypothetical protein